MTAEDLELDPSPSRRGELIFPADDAQSIAAHRIHNKRVRIAPFGAASWPLAALDEGNRPSPTIHFAEWPAGFQDFARQVAYVLINYGNPESLVEERGNNAGPWSSGATISNVLRRLRVQVTWLTTEWSQGHLDTPVASPADLDSQHLDDLKTWIEERHTDARVREQNLLDVVRIWHLNAWLPHECQWPEPVWRHGAWHPRRRTGENKSIPISEATFGPLLEWASAFVTSFASDIFAAQNHYFDRISTRDQVPEMSAVALLDSYVSTGRHLPPKPVEVGGKPGHGAGWHVMEYRHGVSALSFSNSFTRRRKASLKIGLDVTETALDTSVLGTFQGQKWIPFIGVYDVVYAGGGKSSSDGGPLMAHLRTACLILTAALTGMRPEEVLVLEHGCAREPIMRPGGSRLQLIHGYVTKGTRRPEDGSPPRPRPAVWATVPLVATAVRTAEQINTTLHREGGLLYSDRGSVSIYTRTATTWIQSFIEFVNTRLAPHTANPEALRIPDDEDGPITLKRFRRTLAWFLKHRPNGEVTAPIQLQHVGVSMAEGYAGTKESGMPSLLLEEDWNHREATIRQLDEFLAGGKGISGPAAGRAIEATRLIRLLTPSDERRLRKDKSLLVYENPAAMALCVYNERNALCNKLKQTEKDNQPDLLGCVDGCLNSARTDGHLELLKRKTDGLRKQAELSPLPMALSMQALADRNDRIMNDFSSNRLTLDDGGSLAPQGVDKSEGSKDQDEA
jgi:hypothetical protein